LNISPSAIGNYESGRRKANAEIEEALADYFNVSLDFLRGLDSERNLFTDEEYDLIYAFRKADEIDKAMVRRILNIRERKKDNSLQEEDA
jgi:transcriptional regulator with XRE-family HTH domain